MRWLCSVPSGRGGAVSTDTQPPAVHQPAPRRLQAAPRRAAPTCWKGLVRVAGLGVVRCLGWPPARGEAAGGCRCALPACGSKRPGGSKGFVKQQGVRRPLVHLAARQHSPQGGGMQAGRRALRPLSRPPPCSTRICVASSAPLSTHLEQGAVGPPLDAVLAAQALEDCEACGQGGEVGG